MKIFNLSLLIILALSQVSFAAVEPGFVDISEVNKNIKVEMRYASDWNFVGRVISGYKNNKCFLTKEAADALSKVQMHVQSSGYSLLVFDCYRPQRSVSEFLDWTKDSKDQKMKKIFFPDEPKEKLVDRGYIADKSSHSRGSTVDITLVKISKDSKVNSSSPRELSFREEAVDCRLQKNIERTGQINMGTSFDCFNKLANTANPKILGDAKKNRQILKEAMEKFGFVNYPKEWWHFTLKDEPFKDKCFDFTIE